LGCVSSRHSVGAPRQHWHMKFSWSHSHSRKLGLSRRWATQLSWVLLKDQNSCVYANVAAWNMPHRVLFNASKAHVPG
jgi:hypothetical protein